MSDRKEMMDKLKHIENNLNYKFKNIELLKIAMTHSSYGNENNLAPIHNNERLEFLGDSILSLIVSEYLYKKYPNYPEGELTKIRAKVVCESSLSYGALNIGIGKSLLLGKGEELTGGRKRESILADATEALIGAIYLDSNLSTTRSILLNKFEKDIVKAVAKGNLFIDYKTELQERLQKNPNIKIEYIVSKEEGPGHNKIFYMNLCVEDKTIATGMGKNKKEAEQMAAKKALKDLLK
jgi:ribonuclease III